MLCVFFSGLVESFGKFMVGLVVFGEFFGVECKFFFEWGFVVGVWGDWSMAWGFDG